MILLLVGRESRAQIRLDLNTAMEMSEQQNLDIMQSRLNLALSEQAFQDSKRALLPDISFGASNQYNRGLAFDQISGQLVTGDRWSSTANANIALRTALFDGFSKINNIKLASLDIKGSEIELSVQSRAVKLMVLAAYFDALVSLELGKASAEQLVLSKKELASVKIEVDLGIKTLVDLSTMENQVANDELNVLISRNSYENNILTLKQTLNIPLGDSIVLDKPHATLKADLNPLSMISIQRNPSVLLSELQVDKADLRWKMRRNVYYPTLNLSSGYGTNFSSERRNPFEQTLMPFWHQVNQNRNLYIGLSLSVPILDGWKARGAINQARISIDLAKVGAEKTRVREERILRQAYQDYRQSVKENQAYQQQYIAAKRHFEATRERYDIGMASPLELSASNVHYNVSELNQIRSDFRILYNQQVIMILASD